MADKTRYSDAELEEFRLLINDKLDVAKRDYKQLMAALTNSD
ncbi:TraR/DksA family transcriptional regulator, partial [Parabacteroides distasonis]